MDIDDDFFELPVIACYTCGSRKIGRLYRLYKQKLSEGIDPGLALDLLGLKGPRYMCCREHLMNPIRLAQREISTPMSEPELSQMKIRSDAIRQSNVEMFNRNRQAMDDIMTKINPDASTGGALQGVVAPEAAEQIRQLGTRYLSMGVGGVGGVGGGVGGLPLPPSINTAMAVDDGMPSSAAGGQLMGMTEVGSMVVESAADDISTLMGGLTLPPAPVPIPQYGSDSTASTGLMMVSRTRSLDDSPFGTIPGISQPDPRTRRIYPAR